MTIRYRYFLGCWYKWSPAPPVNLHISAFCSSHKDYLGRRFVFFPFTTFEPTTIHHDVVGFEPTSVGLASMSESFDSRRLQGYPSLCNLRYTILADPKRPVITVFNQLLQSNGSCSVWQDPITTFVIFFRS